MIRLFRKFYNKNLLYIVYLWFSLLVISAVYFFVIFVFHIAFFLKIAVTLIYLVITSNVLSKIFILWLKK